MNRAEFDSACATLEIEFPISQTSGRRTPYRNDKVGGHINSYHLSGRGCDYAWDPDTRSGLINRFKLRVKGLDLKLVPGGDHDHLQPL